MYGTIGCYVHVTLEIFHLLTNGLVACKAALAPGRMAPRQIAIA